MNPAILDNVVKAIGEVYAFWDSLNISVTALLIGLVVVVFSFFFAARQALSWFLKIDDVKRDVKRLRELILQVEGEIRVLQAMLPQAARETEAGEKSPNVVTASETGANRPSFRISH